MTLIILPNIVPVVWSISAHALGHRCPRCGQPMPTTWVLHWTYYRRLIMLDNITCKNDTMQNWMCEKEYSVLRAMSEIRATKKAICKKKTKFPA